MLSRGEKLLREITSLYFNNLLVKYNTRPDWLLGLELDVFYPTILLAFEFQGEQHFALNKFNDNSFEKLKKQVFYDREKKRLCLEKGVTLFQIGTFELKPKHFHKMLNSTKFSNNQFLSELGNNFDTLSKQVDAINEKYREYNNGRKCMSMKNPGAREGYLNNLLKMNPQNNRFMRPSF